MPAARRKEFQEATVQHVLARLCAPGGSRRFLIADEVGLGKTLIAQGVIDGMRLLQSRPLRVFYMCSSLSIVAQNADEILKNVPAGQREAVRIRESRLDLLPARRAAAADSAPYHLYTLSPHVTAGQGGGQMDERALLVAALRAICPPLARARAWPDAFQLGASRPAWDAARERVELADDSSLRAFKTHLRDALNKTQPPDAPKLSERCHDATISSTFHDALSARPRRTIDAIRHAMTRAVIESLTPDLIILDEFQRFFEMLPAEMEEASDEEDDSDATARAVMSAVLGAHEPRDSRPHVLLLSATPYRLFTRGSELSQHHTEFFSVLQFLFDEAYTVPWLKEQFPIYCRQLQVDAVGSRAVLELRAKIEDRLLGVMCRTERGMLAPEAATGAVDQVHGPIPVSADDVEVFFHTAQVAKSAGVSGEPYWSSIPYPMQAMDKRYVMRGETGRPLARRNRIDFNDVRQYRRLGLAHPRLRGLFEIADPATMALPWLPPSKPWWGLGGPFARARGASKTLVFSRFRAVPRVLAAVASYEVERVCYENAKRPYDYEIRSRSVTSEGRRSGRKRLPGRFAQPSPSFRESLESLLMFGPLSHFATYGDPLPLAGAHGEALTFELAKRDVVARVQGALEQMGVQCVEGARVRSGHIADAVAILDAGKSRSIIQRWLESPHARRSEGVARACKAFLSRSERMPELQLTSAELEMAAEIAIAAPGVVLWRAWERVFGTANGSDARARRGARLLEIGIGALRTYLDAPEWHELLAVRDSQRRVGYARAVRCAVWNGNLESTLDEWFATLARLGTVDPDEELEEEVKKRCVTALSIHDAQITLRTVVHGKEHRMRCHAAAPLGLSSDEVKEGSEALRADTLRVAFNSPFRPMMLATTSIGQEGLDFHTYCSRIVHWDLPDNAVDLEQRDGRVSRFGSLAVRRAIAGRDGTLADNASPWLEMAKRAADVNGAEAGGLLPWWTLPGASIQRVLLVPSFSQQIEDFAELLNELALYRLALGQPNQDHLVRALRRRLDAAASPEDMQRLRNWYAQAAICLSPFARAVAGSKRRAERFGGAPSRAILAIPKGPPAP